MRKLTKLLAVGLSLVCALGIFSGCGNKGIVIDKTKTQLYVSNHDAGIGRTWLESIGKEFEKTFAEYSFEEGKKGVQVIYNHNRNTNEGLLLEKISGLKEYVFFTEGINYPALASSTSNGMPLIHDVSDIMNKPAIVGVNVVVDEETGSREQSFIYEEGGETIEEKINEEFLDYLDRDNTNHATLTRFETSENEKYYAMPYYLAMKSFIYDRELWNEKGWFILHSPSKIIAETIENNGDVATALGNYDSQIARIIAGDETAPWILGNENGVTREDLHNPAGESWTDPYDLAPGPDGVFGTSDDGLPATVEEFYILMDQIVTDKCEPIIYTGKFPSYADSVTTNVWWNYEGVDNMRTFYSLTGTMTNSIVDLDSQGNFKYNEDGSIKTLSSYTFDNYGKNDGYMAQRMLGKYYALQFAEKIGKSNWLSNEVDNTSVSHISAQSKFLSSVNKVKSGGKRIAMLIDGAWWQQESNYTFTVMGRKADKYSRMKREVAMMPVPNATVERYAEKKINGEKNLVIAQNDSFCVVNGKYADGSVENAVAEAFVSFVNNDKMLNLFTEKTSMFRALNYDIDDNTAGKLSRYGYYLKDYYEDSTVIYPYTSNGFVLTNYGYISNKSNGWNWSADVDVGGSSLDKVTASISSFRIHKNNLTAKKYFNGLYAYSKSLWDENKIQGQA